MGEAEGTITNFQGWGEKGRRGEGEGAGRLAEGSTAHQSIHPCSTYLEGPDLRGPGEETGPVPT